MDTQLVCEEQPHCRCSGQEYDCQCVDNGGTCTACGARLVLIDVDTGKPVAPPTDPRQGSLL